LVAKKVEMSAEKTAGRTAVMMVVK
jgi:hypothetical protein